MLILLGLTCVVLLDSNWFSHLHSWVDAWFTFVVHTWFFRALLTETLLSILVTLHEVILFFLIPHIVSVNSSWCGLSLRHSEATVPLSWATRMMIALGAAKGLAFLHNAERPVIYRDFKTSNILLDSVSSIS